MNKTPVLSFVFFCFILAHRWGKDGNFLMDFLSNTISQKKKPLVLREKDHSTSDHGHTRSMKEETNDGNFHLQKNAYKIS